ncbi:XRE family transcriptional regulator [Methylobacterium sp. DB0501]|uniref:XRE family transcriptional regulator n=1 Tax=Methylobacterium sp. DB0501 TaxID=2709665 RepID=UPI0013EB9C84|nr:XRE family transcriptional regulator [Methylobacterium sp. DB0501]NGM39032.1 XRE family transcriptional regulator [Methylobacterium sp. DB0501]
MGRRVSAPLTATMAAEIKRLARSTDLAQHEIAAKLHINQGRVSEVLNGKRFPEIRVA